MPPKQFSKAKPTVYVLNLAQDPTQKECHVQLMDSLRAGASVKVLTGQPAFLKAMKLHIPHAMIVLHGAVQDPSRAQTKKKLVQYANAGGTVVFCGDFPSTAPWYNSERDSVQVFADYGLPWISGSYLRTTTHLQAHVDGLDMAGLAKSYSVKAQFLSGVSPNQRVYMASSASRIESKVFPSDFFPLELTETPSAYAKVGAGWLGYVGDVNYEDASVRTIIAMAKLPSTAVIEVSGREQLSCITMEQGGDGSLEIVAPTKGKDLKKPPLEIFSDAIRDRQQPLLSGARMGGDTTSTYMRTDLYKLALERGQGDSFPKLKINWPLVNPGKASRGSNTSAAQQPKSPNTSAPAQIKPTSNSPMPTVAPVVRRPREDEVEKRARKRAAHPKRQEAEKFKEMGNEQFKAKNYDTAVAMYLHAIVIRDRAHPTYLCNLAICYLKMEMPLEAESACNDLLHEDPLHIKGRFRRGLARREMHLFKGALQDFHACLRLAKPGVDKEQFRQEIKITRQKSQELYEVYERDPENFCEYIAEIRQKAVEIELLYRDEDDDSDIATASYLPRFLDSTDTDFYWSSTGVKNFGPPLLPSIEDPSDSESSEAEHEGNGIPCRYNNHDGCRHGAQCRFQHAKTIGKSTRDDLGRNVCNHWLLDECKFGQNCVYAHDKTYLPENGWWTNNITKRQMREKMEEFQDAKRMVHRLLHPRSQPSWAEYNYHGIDDYLDDFGYY